MKYNILFYTDWNNKIGIGHIMRCKSIANTASENGLSSIFVSSSNNLSIISNEYECIILDSYYDNLRAEKLSEVIEKFEPELVVIDSYYVTAKFLKGVKRSVNSNNGKLLYIDDCILFDYSCDLILNYNIYSLENKDEYEKIYSQGHSLEQIPELILGMQFVPLRKEFQELKDRVIRKQGVSILVSTGGADTEHIAMTILESAKKYSFLDFHIIVGPLNIDKDIIINKAQDYTNVVIHENVQNMCKLMQSVDMAISAAGSTLYELCVTQTPTITYIIADNQKKAAETFEKYNMMKSVGDIRKISKEVFSKDILQMVVNLANDFEERQQMKLQMKKNIDGNGCNRIIDLLVKKGYLKLR